MHDSRALDSRSCDYQPLVVIRTKTITLYYITQSGLYREPVDIEGTKFALSTQWLVYVRNDEDLVAYHLVTRTTSLIQRGEVSLLVFATPSSITCAWASGEITTHVLNEMEKSPLNRLIIDPNTPVSQSRRDNVLKTLFKDRPIPPYNLDDIIRLYLACGLKVRETGRDKWIPEEVKNCHLRHPPVPNNRSKPRERKFFYRCHRIQFETTLCINLNLTFP